MHYEKLWFYLYVHSQKFGYFGHLLSDKNTLEVKYFDTQSSYAILSITKQKISTKTEKKLTFDFSGLQIYLGPGKAPFATVQTYVWPAK